MSGDPTTFPSNGVQISSAEARRLRALHRYGNVDRSPEEAFDRVTDLAAHLFDVPMAIISFVGDEGQWVKSCVGIDAKDLKFDIPFCAHTIQSDGALVVEDATDDLRFADHPLVTGEPGLRFYAGAPLVTPDDYRIGTVCVLDTTPRSPSEETLRQLENLADMVVDELELRRQVSERTRTEEKVRRIVENAQPIVFMIDREGRFTLSEGRDLEAIGLEPGEAVGESVYDMYADCPEVLDIVERALADHRASDVVTIGDATFDVWCTPFHDSSGEVAGCVGMALDITERKNAQKELERNRDLLRRAQKIANVGGWEYDVQTETLFLTDETCRIHEVPLGTTLDRETAIDFYTPDARPVIQEAVRRAIEEGKSWELELPFVTANDNRRWVRSVGEPRYDGGDVVKLVGAAQDVTERREAEEALRESERRHREFLEQSPVGIYRSTPDGRFLYANDALVDILGFDSFEAMAERNLNEEGFGLADREAFIADLDAQGAVKQRETTWIGPDGETVDLLESAHVVEESGTTVYEGVVEDITERKRAERELRRSRERLATAQRIAGLGSWEHDLKEGELHWSDETRRIFGWEGESVTYDKFMAAVHPEDREELRRQQARAIAEGKPIDVQYRVIRSDTEDRVIHERGEAVFDDGEVVRVSGTVLDVTERKKAEQRLQESNQRLRLALEAANAGTFEFSAVTGRSDWDERTLEIYGLSGEHRTADPPAFYSLVHPEDRAELKAKLEHALDHERQYEVSYRVVRPDGEERYVLSSGVVERDDDGNAKRIIGLNQDISERKRAERELRRSRERWQRLVNAHRDPIQIAVDGTIRYINPAGAELFGASGPREIIGRSVLDFAPSGEVSEAIQARQKKLNRGEPTAPFEHEIRRLDGEVRIIETYSVPIEYDGEQAAQTVLRDVTDDRRRQEALRRSKRKYESLFETSNEAIFIHTLGGRIRDINSRACALFGYPEEELIGRNVSELVPPDRREASEELKALSKGESVHSENKYVRKDGSEFWGELSAAVFETEEERLVQGMIRDITDEKEAKEALRHSRKKYKSLFDTSNDAIFIHDLDGTIRDTNVQASNLFGYTQEQFIGCTVADLVPPDRRNKAHEKLQALREGESIHAENKYRHKDGSTFWGELSATAFEVDNERLVQGMIRDITDRKKAEQARRESESRLRGLANSVPGIIFQFYARPDGEYGLHFVSEQAESVLGLDPEPDGFFERFADRVDPSHREEFLTSVEEAVENIALWNLEIPFCKPSGDTIWIQGVATPEEREGEVVFNGVLLDITCRKQLESQLRQAQKMETVGTLAGGIAHDFNNILHAAMVYLQMGLEELPGEHPTFDFLNRAEKGLKRAETLVDKLLTFSRQEGKTAEERVNVSGVIRETIDLATSSIPDRVQVRTEMDEECCVVGDSGQLQQVAMNLLTNAAQALEAQQKEAETPLVLDIDVRSTEVDEDLAGRYLNLDPGRYVRISISDTGPGMDQETKERIFEPFFTTKDVGKGTGLGLSVVHGIIQAHDGEITVFTQPGEGTTFNVYVPCDSEGEVADESAKSDANESSGHILFVDDDEQVLDLETVRLRGFGYEVTTRQNARTALEAVEAAPEAYDLVLTDYAMPGMSGMKLIRELKDRGYEMPIILMSGFSAKVSEDDVLQAGAKRFLRKPVGSSELEGALNDALERKTTRS